MEIKKRGGKRKNPIVLAIAERKIGGTVI